MQGLMYRLAEFDADSAGLVRVIDYFDALLRHGADITEVLRASAGVGFTVTAPDNRARATAMLLVDELATFA